MKLTKKIEKLPNLEQVRNFLLKKGFKVTNKFGDEYEIHIQSNSSTTEECVLVPPNETIFDYSTRIIDLIRDLEWILGYSDEISIYNEIIDS